MMWLVWILLVGIVALLLYRMFPTGGTVEARENSEMEILRKRYAKGEIGRDEYEQMKQDLKYED